MQAKNSADLSRLSRLLTKWLTLGLPTETAYRGVSAFATIVIEKSPAATGTTEPHLDSHVGGVGQRVCVSVEWLSASEKYPIKYGCHRVDSARKAMRGENRGLAIESWGQSRPGRR